MILKTYGISLDDLVTLDDLRNLVNLIRNTFRCRTTVRDVVLDSKVIIGASGVVARSEQDTTVRLVFADDIGCCRCGEDRIFSNDELLHPICGPDPQDSLNGLWGEVTTIASDDERRTLGSDRVEYSLDKILSIMLATTRKKSVISWDYRGGVSRTSSWNTFTLRNAD